MVDFAWGSSYFVKVDEKDGLVVLKRQSDKQFTSHALFNLSGTPLCVCWATDDLIFVGMELKKEEAKIEVISFDKGEPPENSIRHRRHLVLHKRSVNKIIAEEGKLRLFS